jgi:hypothetical protein
MKVALEIGDIKDAEKLGFLLPRSLNEQTIAAAPGPTTDLYALGA